ncbi:MAG TPA: DedA family protein [Acidimicrobiales bacterium]|jgi:membrane protein DedA with SNARE-associated domain|nr:DedA family protein [Acidimicrobiales bacterium]
MSIHHLITSYGYLAVFLLIALESFGVPLPGETALIVAATYAGATHRLSPEVIFLVGSAGAIIGDTCGYWIGDKGGYPLLRRYGHYVRLDVAKLKVARYMFLRHGGKVVFFGRFVSVLRTYAAFLAGLNKMHYRRFLAFNASGGIIWCAVFTFGAYWFGNRITKIAGPVGLVLLGVAVIVIIASIVIVRKQFAALTERAEAAFPGPLDPSDEAAPPTPTG